MLTDLLTQRRMSARQAGAELPDRPGLYAVFVDNPLSIPFSFRLDLQKRDRRDLLYIGRSSKSLLDRVWRQEFRHKSPGTFFRSIGVMLGYDAVVGGRNFKFSISDTAKITEWILNELSTTWIELPPDASASLEKCLIKAVCPILNRMHNPRFFRHLADLRTIARKVSSP